MAVLSLPAAVFALTAFTPAEATSIIAANDYITFGIAFVLPVFLVMLNMTGALSGRTFLKSWRIVVDAVMLVSAMAAPGPDPTTTFYLAVPLLALFFVAVGLCLLLDRRRARKEAKHAAATGATADAATSQEELESMGLDARLP